MAIYHIAYAGFVHPFSLRLQRACGHIYAYDRRSFGSKIVGSANTFKYVVQIRESVSCCCTTFTKSYKFPVFNCSKTVCRSKSSALNVYVIRARKRKLFLQILSANVNGRTRGMDSTKKTKSLSIAKSLYICTEYN